MLDLTLSYTWKDCSRDCLFRVHISASPSADIHLYCCALLPVNLFRQPVTGNGGAVTGEWLVITDSMANLHQPVTYTCKASNTVSGQSYTVERKVTFTVGKREYQFHRVGINICFSRMREVNLFKVIDAWITAEQKKLCLYTGSSFPIRYINFKINFLTFLIGVLFDLFMDYAM